MHRSACGFPFWVEPHTHTHPGGADVNVYEAAEAEQPAYHPDGIVDDEPVTFTAIAEFTSNAQHQFCTPSCLGAWAMNRALDTQ